MRNICVALAIGCWTFTSAHAQEEDPFELEILSSAPKNFSYAAAPAKNRTPYLGTSYLRLANASGETLNTIFGATAERKRGQLLKDEFYTQLKTHTGFNDAIVFGKCGDRAPGNWYLTVMLNISYKGRAGEIPIQIIKDQLVLVAGNDKRAACSLKKLDSDQELHSLLYSGLPVGQGQYTLTFDVLQGETSSASAFGMIVKLANSVLKFFPQINIPAVIVTEPPIIAGEIDKLIDRENSKFSVTSQYKATLTATRGPSATETKASRLLVNKDGQPSDNPGQLEPAVGFFLTVSSPLIEAIYEKQPGEFGVLEIYSSRSASLLIDAAVEPEAKSTTPLAASWILRDQSLGTSRVCFPAATGCKSKERMTFEAALKAERVVMEEILSGTAESEKETGDVKAASPAPPKTPEESQAAKLRKLYAACIKIAKLGSELGLSPIDALLARWAVLSQPSVDLIKTFPKADGPHSICWSTKDAERLAKIGDVMKVSFENR